MKKRPLNTKIKIEKLEKQLDKNNCWVSEYTPWKEIWTSMSIKYISSTKIVYVFIVKWRRNFPQKFRVRLNDEIFTPMNKLAIDHSSNLIIFHATINQ